MPRSCSHNEKEHSEEDQLHLLLSARHLLHHLHDHHCPDGQACVRGQHQKENLKISHQDLPSQHLCVVFLLGVLPTVVAHPACRAHQHLLDPEPCHSSTCIFSTYITLTSNLNIHSSIFVILALHLYIANVHTLNFRYLKALHLFYIIQPFIYTIAIKYIATVILTYLSHTSSTASP